MPRNALFSRITPWIALGSVVVVVCVRASLPGREADEFRAPDASRRQIFIAMAAQEPEWRDKASKAFPADPWSQDDMVHSLEMQRAWTMASGRGLSISDVLRAVDDGMREGWGIPGQLNAKVPPCHPRLEY
jgi:hypothetical protein